MKKYNSFIVILFILFSHSGFSSVEVLSNFDKKIYRLKDIGLKDLAFKVNVDGLAERVKEQIPTAKIEEIYFNVYTVPNYNKVYLEVVGLPQGFETQKKYLKSLLKPYLEQINPIPFGDQVKDYSVSEQKEGETLKVVAQDKTYKKEVTQIDFIFSQGQLVSLSTQASRGNSNTDFSYQEMPNSKGKYLLKKSSQEAFLGNLKKSSLTLVDYETVEGYVLPKKIEITESLSPAKTTKLSKTEIQNSELKLNFYDYKVNEGVAIKYIANKKEK